MAPLRLAPGMYVCASEDGAVLLDLNNDKYVGFSPEQSSALSTLVADWPRVAAGVPVTPEDAAALAQHMRERGVLANNDRSDASPPRSPPLVVTELMPSGEMRWRHVRAGHFIRFLQALVVAVWVLKFFGLPRAVQRARGRKGDACGKRTDIDSLQVLLSSYYHLRTFFFAPRGRCLLDSVVLMEFLSHYGVRPMWVIGVQIRPFAAHSWLQIEFAVLNGTAEYARAYQPLLTV